MQDFTIIISNQRHASCINCGCKKVSMLNDDYLQPIFELNIRTLSFMLCESCLRELSNRLIPNAIHAAEEKRKVVFISENLNGEHLLSEGILLRVEDESIVVEKRQDGTESIFYTFPRESWGHEVFMDQESAKQYLKQSDN